jgi:hypothetical protein
LTVMSGSLNGSITSLLMSDLDSFCT